MSTKFVIIILCAACLCACDGTGTKRNNADSIKDSAEQIKPNRDIDFTRTDSVEFIYYPDPAQQKIYEVRGSSDSAFINALVNNLHDSSITSTPCVHYRKLYLFTKGEVFKTIYVSDSCNYLAFAVNGEQYYRRLQAATREKLRLLEGSRQRAAGKGQ